MTIHFFSHLSTENEHCQRFISGRAALGALLDNTKPFRRAFIPLFTCDTVLEAFHLRNIPIVRYRVKEDLSPVIPDDITEQDLLLLTNYFGLTGAVVNKHAEIHKGPIIVDAATALYYTPPEGISCFYSPRKFCQTPTGGIAVSAVSMTKLQPQATSSIPGATCLSRQMQIFRMERFLHHREERLCHSDSSQLNSFPWLEDSKTRIFQYELLHRRLKHINRLSLPNRPPSAPLCYPLLSGIPYLRDDLADAGVRLPLYWPEVIRKTNADDTENYLARNLLPLPLGIQYKMADIQRIADCILSE